MCYLLLLIKRAMGEPIDGGDMKRSIAKHLQ